MQAPMLARWGMSISPQHHQLCSLGQRSIWAHVVLDALQKLAQAVLPRTCIGALLVGPQTAHQSSHITTSQGNTMLCRSAHTASHLQCCWDGNTCSNTSSSNTRSPCSWPAVRTFNSAPLYRYSLSMPDACVCSVCDKVNQAPAPASHHSKTSLCSWWVSISCLNCTAINMQGACQAAQSTPLPRLPQHPQPP
jgi:hypothetical protein